METEFTHTKTPKVRINPPVETNIDGEKIVEGLWDIKQDDYGDLWIEISGDKFTASDIMDLDEILKTKGYTVDHFTRIPKYKTLTMSIMFPIRQYYPPR